MSEKARDYSDFYRTPFGKEVLRREAEYVAHALGSCRRIIHVGCGPGFLEESLPQMRIVGADISEQMLRQAKERSPGPLACTDGQHLCFKSSVCDGVLFVTSLEFIEDHRMALKEALRVLRPGGKLLVLMLNPHSEYFRERQRRPGSYYSRVRHTNADEMTAAVAALFKMDVAEYLLGIRGASAFATSDPSVASLFAIHASKPIHPARQSSPEGSERGPQG